MLKKIMKGVVIGGAALTLAASAAQAATYEINLYGASAQFKFWTEAAPGFLAEKLSCPTTSVFTARNSKGDGQLDGQAIDRDAGIAVCVGTDGVGSLAAGAGFNHTDGSTGNTMIVRYTAKASYDGVRSILGDNDTSLIPSSDAACGAGNRYQPSVNGNTWLPYGDANSASQEDGISQLDCLPVTVGASDVSARTFKQESKGMVKGPHDGGVVTRHVEYGVNLDDPEKYPSTYDVAQPIVVPFGFFNNLDNPIGNMTRLMATSIFSGTVSNWNQFSEAGDAVVFDEPMVVCLRHAGSGTAATLDAAIMRGEATLVKNEAYDGLWWFNNVDPTGASWDADDQAASDRYDSNGNIKVFFNDGSSDLVRCVKAFSGAVGYADYDKCKDPSSDPDSKCYKVDQMTYQGVEGVASKIRNGQYEFWAAQYLYYKDADPANSIVKQLIQYTESSDRLPESKKPFWSSTYDMKWSKSDDFAWPAKK